MAFYFDTAAAVQRLNDMQINLHELADTGIGLELHDWQVEDMKRKFPNTDDPSFLSTETVIWPRSRTYDQAHKNRARRRPLSPMPRLIGVGKPGASRRPILRPALYEKLVERMRVLMANKLKWRRDTNGN